MQNCFHSAEIFLYQISFGLAKGMTCQTLKVDEGPVGIWENIHERITLEAGLWTQFQTSTHLNKLYVIDQFIFNNHR